MWFSIWRSVHVQYVREEGIALVNLTQEPSDVGQNKARFKEASKEALLPP